jgi:hypothetical protein
LDGFGSRNTTCRTACDPTDESERSKGSTAEGCIHQGAPLSTRCAPGDHARSSDYHFQPAIHEGVLEALPFAHGFDLPVGDKPDEGDRNAAAHGIGDELASDKIPRGI